MATDFFQRLESYAQRRPDPVALQSVSDEARAALTYGQLVQEVRDLSCFFEKSGLRPGEHVAILMEENLRWGVAFIGAYSAGLVVAPLDPAQEFGVLADIINHCDCKLVVTSPRHAQKAREILKRDRSVRFLFDGDLDGLGYDWDRDVGVCRDATVPLPLVSRDAQSDLAILYTGGTTGSPKGVRLSEDNIFCTIIDMIEVCPLTHEDNILSILPLYHIMSLLANLLGPLYLGAKVTYIHYRDPSRIISAFKEEDVTGFLCVPQFFYLLNRRIFDEIERQPLFLRYLFYGLFHISKTLRSKFGWRIGKIFFGPIHSRFGPRFRLFGVGGARFEPVVAEALLNLGFSLFQSYGMTETSGPATITPPDAFGGLTCGLPMAHVEIRIDNPNESGIGEILVRGGHVTKGYWNDPAATAGAIRSGWLWTGDLGRIDSGGRLNVTGRKKEVIVLSSGKNVFPEAVEFHLQNGSPILKEVCVVAVSGALLDGDLLHAIVVPDFERLKSGNIANITDRIRYDIETLGRELPVYQRVRSFEIRTAPLPRTSTRKLKRFEIFPAVLDRGPGLNEPPDGDVEAWIFQLIREVKSDCAAIHSGMNLELDLDFDLLERVELFANLRRRFGLDISDEVAARTMTVKELSLLIENSPSVSSASRVQWAEILQSPLSAEQARMAARLFWRNAAIEIFGFSLSRIIHLAAKHLLPLKAAASERIPRTGPFIICANHASYIDALIIAGSTPFPVFRRLFFFGASKYARSPLQRILCRALRIVSIDADVNLQGALRLGAEGLRRGFVLCVFPEGHRSIDGTLQSFRNGPAILAKELGASVLPVSIAGSHQVWARASKRFQLRPVDLRFGEMLDPAGAQTYDEFTEQIRRAVDDGLRQPSAFNVDAHV